MINANQCASEIVRDVLTQLRKLDPGDTLQLAVRRHKEGNTDLFSATSSHHMPNGRGSAAKAMEDAYDEVSSEFLPEMQQSDHGVTNLRDSFDLMIGRMDRMLSEMIHWSQFEDLDFPDRQTLKHHAEDMIGAATKVLKNLGHEVDASRAVDQFNQPPLTCADAKERSAVWRPE